MKNALRLRVALVTLLPLIAAGVAQPARAVAVNGIASVAHALDRRTDVPVMLPVRLPDSLASEGLYARVARASATTYTVDLASTPHCAFTPWCFVGAVEGSTRALSPNGRRGTLVWKRGSAWYRLAIAGASPYTLRSIAHSLRRY